MRKNRQIFLGLFLSFLVPLQAKAGPLCPAGIGSVAGDIPALLYRGERGKILMVCGYEEAKKSSREKFMSEFQVIAPHQKKNILFEADATESYKVSLLDRGISLTEFITFPVRGISPLQWGKDGIRRVPFRSFDIVTNGTAFVMSRSRCVYDFKMDRKDVKSILNKADQTMKQLGGRFLLDETLPYEVLACAMSGNREAADLLRGFQKKFEADGSVAESVEEAQRVYETSLKIGCKTGSSVNVK